LHTNAADFAATERLLFATEQKAGLSNGIHLRFPEQFNNGSPHNVQAGQQADLSKVFAYYEEQRQQGEQERLAKHKDGKIRTVYDTAPEGVTALP